MIDTDLNPEPSPAVLFLQAAIDDHEDTAGAAMLALADRWGIPSGDDTSSDEIYYLCAQYALRHERELKNAAR